MDIVEGGGIYTVQALSRPLLSGPQCPQKGNIHQLPYGKIHVDKIEQSTLYNTNKLSIKIYKQNGKNYEFAVQRHY